MGYYDHIIMLHLGLGRWPDRAHPRLANRRHNRDRRIFGHQHFGNLS